MELGLGHGHKCGSSSAGVWGVCVHMAAVVTVSGVQGASSDHRARVQGSGAFRATMAPSTGHRLTHTKTPVSEV